MDVGKLEHSNLVVTEKPMSPKIAAGLIATFASQPHAVLKGVLNASATPAELIAWVNVDGFRLDHIANDIFTFRNATQVIVERLAEHEKVVSIEGGRELGPTQQRSGNFAG